MEKNKGFTLIELLTVIAILAIILLISVPTILGVMDKSKKQAFIESGISIVKALSTEKSVDTILENKIELPELGKSKSVSLSEIGYENASDIKGNVVISNVAGEYKYYLYITNGEYKICNKEYSSIQQNEVEKGKDCGKELLYPTIENKHKEQTYNYKYNVTEEMLLEGVSANDSTDGNITDRIIYKSNINTSILGQYEVIYTVENSLGNTATTTRTVYVKDLQAPKILNTINSVNLNKGEKYTNFLTGITVTDNYDSNINATYICKNASLTVIDCNDISKKAGLYYVIYDAVDTSGNKYSETSSKEVKRTITVKDISGPNLVLKGDNPYTMEIGSTYKEPGYESIDDEDGDITSSVTTSSDLNTKKLGTYEIEYISIDKAGNKSRVVRIVKVVDTTAPTITGVTGNPTSWTTSATLVVNATDNVGIKEYSFDDGTTWQTGNSKKFTSNGTINIKVKDTSDNISTTTVVITKVDSIAPTISINSGTKTVDENISATDNIYTLVTGESGGTVNCLNNTTKESVTTYDTLRLGLNNVTCTATSGTGKTASATGNITLNQVFIGQSGNRTSNYILYGTTSMSNGDVQYGPYRPATKGRYKITYTGQGFGIGNQYVDSYQHRDPGISFSTLNVSYSNSNIVYYIDVEENLWGLETRLTALNSIKIENLKIEYVGELIKYVDNGLVVHYDGYNRPSNNTWSDLSGKGNNGVLTGFSSLDGSEYNSVYFNGSNYITGVNNNPLYSESNKLPNMTVEIIFKKTTSSWGNIISFNHVVNEKSYMDLWTTLTSDSRGYQVNYIYKNNVADYSYTLGWGSYPLGSIVKISYSKNENVYKTYVNGKEVDSKTLNNLTGFDINSFKIGAAENGYNFTGHVYSVRVYNRALTANEINNNNIVDKYRFGI